MSKLSITEISMKKRQDGIALLMVLVVVLVLALSSAAFLALTSSDLALTRREKEATQVFYVAQAGVEKAVAELKVLYSKNKGYTTQDLAGITSPAYEGFKFDEFTIAYDGLSVTGTLEHGSFKGLQGEVRKIKISAVVSSEKHDDLTVRLAQELELQYIPLFQFAIFYNDILEILPLPVMDVTGPVHCNSDIYMSTYATLSFDSIVSAVGNIYHQRTDGYDPSDGPVRIKDSNGVYQNMQNPDGTWLDSNHEDWAEESQNRWDGNVRSAAHGVQTLELPLTNEEQPRTLIERGEVGDSPEMQGVKLYYKADLRIIDGWAYDKSGMPVDLTYQDPGDPSNTINPISTKTFYDNREGKTISVTEVDIDKLNDSGKAPDNGILYVSNNGGNPAEQDAVRLVNGEELPSQGLTVATDKPLYIWGDYNTVSKKPASVMSDSLNILSNNWQDKNSEKNLNKRKASNTEVNAAVITGNTDTSEQHNGGVHNMPRFLEDWSGRNFLYRGSLVSMWESQIATGHWYYGSPYYEPPDRDWGYDPDLSDPAKIPPGAPSVYSVATARWQYE